MLSTHRDGKYFLSPRGGVSQNKEISGEEKNGRKAVLLSFGEERIGGA